VIAEFNKTAHMMLQLTLCSMMRALQEPQMKYIAYLLSLLFQCPIRNTTELQMRKVDSLKRELIDGIGANFLVSNSESLRSCRQIVSPPKGYAETYSLSSTFTHRARFTVQQY
jgi:hypothetical protein